MRQVKQEEIPKKRRMVTRTPSRLYRFADPSALVSHGTVDGRGPAILGPEFVVRSKEPVKMLSLLHGSQTQVCSIADPFALVSHGFMVLLMRF